MIKKIIFLFFCLLQSFNLSAQQLCDIGEFDFLTQKIKLINTSDSFTFSAKNGDMSATVKVDSLGFITNYHNSLQILRDLCFGKVEFRNRIDKDNKLTQRDVFARIENDMPYSFTEYFNYKSDQLSLIKSKDDTLYFHYDKNKLAKIQSYDRVIFYSYIEERLQRIEICNGGDCKNKKEELNFIYVNNTLDSITDNFGYVYKYFYKENRISQLKVFHDEKLIGYYNYYYNNQFYLVMDYDKSGILRTWSIFYL